MPSLNTPCSEHNANERRYTRRLLITMAGYVAVLFGSILLLRNAGSQWPLPVRALIALTPVLPIAFFCRAYVDFLNGCDEMMRRIELEAVGLSSLIVGLLFLSLGFLGRAKILPLDGVAVAVWVFPLLCGFYGVTKWLASRRYQ